MPYKLFVVLILITTNSNSSEADTARKRWAESKHGQLLERIIPPGFTPQMLPEPRSRGAQRRNCTPYRRKHLFRLQNIVRIGTKGAGQ